MIKIKVPQVIKIGCYSYKVLFRCNMRNDEGFEGACQHRLDEIAIEPTISPVRKVVVLLHEIIHLIDRNHEINLDDATTSRLANGLTELLLDNLHIEFDWEDI